MSLFLKEIQEHSSQLIDTIFLHLKNLPYIVLEYAL